ncbi:MAG: hypothetical protein A2030_03155 [Chloroflexi bacterium RBG_19FT_COMBO_50_10]|nr:MAG: hypothetical protein A2030_03155 [Chloroflexi bacterium RBG_19FT_COMBO_50_10]
MRINKPIKILLGVLTAWVAIYPLLSVSVWLFFIFSVINTENQTNPDENLALFLLMFFMFLIFISSFLELGLKAFYTVHIILNKSGNDIVRTISGVLMLFFSFIAMPVYYFIYIFPDTPPKWALASNSGREITSYPIEPSSTQPNA